MSALTFGKRNRYRFMSGGTLEQWKPAGGGAIYAVTYKADAVSRPKNHTVVFFGETPDLSLQAESIRRELQKWWNENGGSNGDLFLHVHEMPGSSQFERISVQKQLISEYDPHGNN
ncbi:MAG TPA: hypothetical protein EYN91_00955 [Candidatus Melainabacteria bacterium]|jgi:hypothetical protein|nr:hypothetical protein [Candidatus Melainabacteria bacterium]HIN63473.1 hypothetical protein [Candidatus Obscuribacterales bacterium]